MPSNRSVGFVDYVIKQINFFGDKGFGAKMRKADNEATEHQSWEILSQWVNLDWESDRKAFGLIGASIARVKPISDGSISLGKALRIAHVKDKDIAEIQKSSSALRLRRILACKDREELMTVIRSLFRYLESKDIILDYAQLLDEIMWFNDDERRERTRSRWAQDFFRSKEES